MGNRSGGIVLCVGCGDLGTGVAHLLFRKGYSVVGLELERPLAVRRRAAFAESVRCGAVTVEGVTCRLLSLSELEEGGWEGRFVPLLVARLETALAALGPGVLVDARLAKGHEPAVRHANAFVVVLGPGYAAGRDCDAAIETWVGSSRVDLQACKLEYSIVSPK